MLKIPKRNISFQAKDMTEKPKAIPYGISNFMDLRLDHHYYVDKTRFLPVLEMMGKFIFLIRPRRMGKSLWLSILECYYDIFLKDRFEELFQDTFIQKNPTSRKNSFLILKFNFSQVNPNLDQVEESFETDGKIVFKNFISKYKHLFDDEFLSDLKDLPRTADKLKDLFSYVATHDLKLYVIIDEYDNFSNTILTSSGQQSYLDLTHGPGFFRYFFNVLKGGTSVTGPGEIRLFITGVSPITMDDVTSGFNIGKNISLEPEVNCIIGFTETEVREILSYYQKAGEFSLDLEEAMNVMKEWYDHYRFSEEEERSVFNSDLVLYFVDKANRLRKIPKRLIDNNVRIGYDKLRYLITVDRRLNGNFSRLQQIIEKGEIRSEVVESFPLEEILDPKNFHSLLFYFGLLSFGKQQKGTPYLAIPNQTVRQLLFGYIRDALHDVNCFRVDLWTLSDLIYEMAYEGKWEAVMDFLAEEIKKQTTIRDYLSEEKIVQGFLLSYLNVTDYFLNSPEIEANKGYSDFFLEPFWTKYPDMQYGYLIELKYIKRSEYSKKLLKKKIKEAETQLTQYQQDSKIQQKMKKGKLHQLILIFHGWELVYRENFEVV